MELDKINYRTKPAEESVSIAMKAVDDLMKSLKENP